MQFKRCRLVPAKPVVNAALASTLFLFAACGNGGEEPVSQDTEIAVTGDVVSLPAVWSTSRLQGEVADIALAGGAASTLAIAYEGRGLEFFDLEAERRAEAAPLGVRKLASGAYVDFGDTALILFPGISDENELGAYVYAEGLVAPQLVELPIEPGGDVHGVCARQRGSAGIIDLAYWTLAPGTGVVRGELTVEGNAFVWTETGTQPLPSIDTSCVFDGNELVFSGEGDAALAQFDRPGIAVTLSLDAQGGLSASGPDGRQSVSVRDGLSVRTPTPIVAMAALGTPFGGGYPQGLIVIAGSTGEDHQAVFVDTTPLVASVAAAE